MQPRFNYRETNGGKCKERKKCRDACCLDQSPPTHNSRLSNHGYLLTRLPNPSLNPSLTPYKCPPYLRRTTPARTHRTDAKNGRQSRPVGAPGGGGVLPATESWWCCAGRWTRTGGGAF
jgi:hypothetical protein